MAETYEEVKSLKLGGMAAGTSIAGVGNVAWTCVCKNGDQLALVTKCYYVPSANTHLLSPQAIFDKQNGQASQFWGDVEIFHLQYQSKLCIDIPYALDSNLPVGYALTSPGNEAHQINNC